MIRTLTWIVFVVFVQACGGQTSSGGNGGNTNWLSRCVAPEDCDRGEVCADGACVVSCDADRDCAGLNPEGSCADEAPLRAGNLPSCQGTTTQRVCAPPCDSNRDCAAIGDGYRCEDNLCQAVSCNEEAEHFPGCFEGGIRYALGEQFASSDGCNTCECTEEGVECTLLGCEPGPRLCTFEGRVRQDGEAFTAVDGCTECECNDGTVTCDDQQCSPSSPCNEEADCSDGKYCQRNSCDSAGTCVEPSPASCDDVYEPVCGCDGVTYGNACEAGGRGIAHQGECGGPATCRSDGDCPDGQACAQTACDEPGTCEDEKPDDCTLEYDPVCGCDGVTYSNVCDVEPRGIAYEGKCEDSEDTCSSDEDCEDDEICVQSACDLPGVCEEPAPLECVDIYQPVCGCDGVTYDNECYAAGRGIAHEGQCQTTEGECLTDDDCDGNQVCAQSACDVPGTCEERGPAACDDIYQPVCACNGVTYDNECSAGGRGIAHEGPCETEEASCLRRGRLYAPGEGYEVGCNGCGCVDGIFACTEAACDASCRSDEDCTNGQVCNFVTCNGEGLCESPNTRVCNTTPVETCGCDGVTYPDQCDALGAGLAHFGACGAGCAGDADCEGGEYCVRDNCEEPGKCMEIDTDCMDVATAPLCGCDGTTYRNQCEAGGRGIARSGECSADE